MPMNHKLNKSPFADRVNRPEMSGEPTELSPAIPAQGEPKAGSFIAGGFTEGSAGLRLVPIGDFLIAEQGTVQ